MQKIILISSCLLAVVADTLFVLYAKSKSHANWLLISGLTLIVFASAIWAYSMRKGIESTMAITYYALLTVIACSLVGVLIFHESLSPLNIAGIILALIALVMIGL